jgi:hypothetical protein
MSHVVAFVPTNSRTFDRAYRFSSSKPLCSVEESSPASVAVSEGDGLADVLMTTRRTGFVGFIYSSIAGFFTGLGGYVAQGMASEETIEMAELPPPYIPAIFGVFLLAGVGILTSTLGNVMDEGTRKTGACKPASRSGKRKFLFHFSSDVDRCHLFCRSPICSMTSIPRGIAGTAEWSSGEERNRKKSLIVLQEVNFGLVNHRNPELETQSTIVPPNLRSALCANLNHPYIAVSESLGGGLGDTRRVWGTTRSSTPYSVVNTVIS